METCWTRGCDLVRGHDGGHTLVNFAAPPTEGWGHSGPCGPNCSCDLAMALRPDAPAHEPARCGCRAICQVGEPYVVHSPRDLHERLEAALFYAKEIEEALEVGHITRAKGQAIAIRAILRVEP